MNALSPRRRLVDSVSSLAPADAYGRLQRRQGCRLHLLRAALGAALQASHAKPSEAALALATMMFFVDCSGRSTAMQA